MTRLEVNLNHTSESPQSAKKFAFKGQDTGLQTKDKKRKQLGQMLCNLVSVNDIVSDIKRVIAAS